MYPPESSRLAAFDHTTSSPDDGPSMSRSIDASRRVPNIRDAESESRPAGEPEAAPPRDTLQRGIPGGSAAAADERTARTARDGDERTVGGKPSEDGVKSTSVLPGTESPALFFRISTDTPFPTSFPCSHVPEMPTVAESGMVSQPVGLRTSVPSAIPDGWLPQVMGAVIRSCTSSPQQLTYTTVGVCWPTVHGQAAAASADAASASATRRRTKV